MSIETGRAIRHLQEAAIQKGERALEFSKRAVKPTLYIIGASGILAGTSFLATHLQEDKKALDSIDAHVRKTYPKTVSPQDYEIAKLVIHFANENRDSSYPDLPPHAERYKQNIAQEYTRSQDASKMRGQLKDEYKAKTGPRKTIDIAVIALSLAAFLVPTVRRKMAGNLKNSRSNATFPEPEDP